MSALIGGAWLVGLWMVGVVIMLIGLGLAVDAFLRDTSDDKPRQGLSSHEQVLERYRRAR